MNQKRSIQDIIPPARSKPLRPHHHHAHAEQENDVSEKGNSAPPKKPPRPPKLRTGAPAKKNGLFGFTAIIILVLIIVGIAFGVVSTVFHRADITLTLRTFSVPISESFEASPDGALLSFAERTVSETMSKTVPRSGSEFVEERASGTITIFNEYSKANQRLIANTRFESKSGLIYRIQSPVTVPGYTTGAGGAIVPGKLEVTVYADEPGEQYNVGAADFTIPGLKGTTQFDEMYARADTPLSGGFVGERAVVSPEVRDAAVASLRSELDRAVRAKFTSEQGADEIFFPDTAEVRFIEQPTRTVEDGALVTLTAEATAPVFDGIKLARVIAEEGGIAYERALAIENPGALAALVEDSEIAGNIRLTVSGDAMLVGVYDEAQLLADLAGKDRRNVGVVLAGYPAIADMKISVYPFWRGTVPEDVPRLTVRFAEGENPQ
ncbi:MAG: hypothetical protein ACE5F4_00940 [Candidatus Paceibacteria bacterium]